MSIKLHGIVQSINCGEGGAIITNHKKYAEKNQAFVRFGKKSKEKENQFNLTKNGSLKEAANNQYKIMRKIKKKNFKSIAFTKIPNIGIGRAAKSHKS